MLVIRVKVLALDTLYGEILIALDFNSAVALRENRAFPNRFRHTTLFDYANKPLVASNPQLITGGLESVDDTRADCADFFG